MLQTLDNKMKLTMLKKYSAVLLLFLLLMLNAVMTPNFFAMNTFNLMLTQICPTILCAMGMTMVIATGGIDISVGAVMALAASISVRLLNFEGPGSVAMLLLVCLVAIVMASCSGLIAGFFIGKLGVQPMVVTLGLLIGVRGLAIVVSDSQTIYLNGVPGGFYQVLGTYKLAGVIPVQVIPIVLSILLTYFLMNKTIFGRRVQAVGNNRRSAKLAGIHTASTLLVVYWLCALLASIGGIFATAKIGSFNPNDLGLLTELDAIAAVVIGGTKMSGGRARVFGTVVGAFIMIILTMSVNMNNIPHEFAQILKAIIIVVAVYIQQDKK